jgi:16S rRNA (cytidine1402-2'-O)-methyltransferase
MSEFKQDEQDRQNIRESREGRKAWADQADQAGQAGGRSQSGQIILAATPIGNVGDASKRLVEALQSVDIVAAEDTRRLFDLANRLGVRVAGQVVAYHDHNEHDKADELLDMAAAGKQILVVSDAGMPTINDPGLTLVRHAIEREIPVTCLPGPSAVLDALALSGLATDRFCFEGFVPRKHTDRVEKFRVLAKEQRTIIFYETPHRIAETMPDIVEIFGNVRQIVLARELTKDYEELRRGTAEEVAQSVVDTPPKGEIVLVIAGAGTDEGAGIDSGLAQGDLSIEDLAELSLGRSQARNLKIKEAIAQVIEEHPLADGSHASRKEIYELVLRMKS